MRLRQRRKDRGEEGLTQDMYWRFRIHSGKLSTAVAGRGRGNHHLIDPGQIKEAGAKRKESVGGGDWFAAGIRDNLERSVVSESEIPGSDSICAVGSLGSQKLGGGA